MVAKLLGHILMIFRVILDAKMVPKSYFFACNKTTRFQLAFFTFLEVFLMVFGVIFRTLEPSKMSISSRRNIHFHIFGLPKSRSKKKSPRSSNKKQMLAYFWTIFWRCFLVKNASRNQVQKNVGKKTEKSGPRGC